MNSVQKLIFDLQKSPKKTYTAFQNIPKRNQKRPGVVEKLKMRPFLGIFKHCAQKITEIHFEPL